MAAGHEGRCETRIKSSPHSLLGNGLSNDDVGVARRTTFQDMRPAVGLETGDFVKEKVRGGGLP